MKRTALVLLLVICWASCGYGAWGLTMGWFTNEFPEIDHRGIAGMMAFCGPFGLIATTIQSIPELHWRVHPLHTEPHPFRVTIPRITVINDERSATDGR